MRRAVGVASRVSRGDVASRDGALASRERVAFKRRASRNALEFVASRQLIT
jgi:hypothetical protein